MRKFLLILACAFSVSSYAETNIVELTEGQLSDILTMADFLKNLAAIEARQLTDGRCQYYSHPFSTQRQAWEYLTGNQIDILQYLHLLFTGNTGNGYDVSKNNILAYASSLRSHNEDVRELLDNIESNTHGLWLDFGRFFPYATGIYDMMQASTNNFERLYDAITNLDFKVSISNQIDLLQVMSGSISNNLDSISNILAEINKNISDPTRPLLTKLNDIQSLVFSINDEAFVIDDTLNNNHHELMDFLQGLTNGSFFASNLCNCCNNSMISNYQDSVISMMMWITNKWPNIDQAEPPEMDGDNSNRVWAIWRPQEVAPSGWFHLYVPTVEWVEDVENNGNFRARYGDSQYDSVYNAVWEQYQRLLQDYRANGIDGQQFFAGLVDLQLHIMANMSTQLYMIDQKLPSKTNLWDWIEQYKQTVADEVKTAEDENNSIVESVSSMLDYSPFGMVGGHFPKVSNALNSLRLEEGASPVVRIPIPRALRVSDSDELIVDVRESSWFSSGRNWCRWIFTFVWGWLFIRIGLVPILYIFFYTLRIAEISAHLVFMGSVRGSSGIVSSFGASAVDLALSLIGIDTDFKKFVWGIMRD